MQFALIDNDGDYADVHAIIASLKKFFQGLMQCKTTNIHNIYSNIIF